MITCCTQYGKHNIFTVYRPYALDLFVKCASHLAETQAYQNVFKCLKPKLPVARTLVLFISKDDETLTFEQVVQDYEPPKHETGYMSVFTGDSGAPCMFSAKEQNSGQLSKADQYAFVAIVVGGLTFNNEAHGSYTKDRKYQCRSIATKLSEDIVAWIKRKANIIA